MPTIKIKPNQSWERRSRIRREDCDDNKAIVKGTRVTIIENGTRIMKHGVVSKNGNYLVSAFESCGSNQAVLITWDATAPTTAKTPCGNTAA